MPQAPPVPARVLALTAQAMFATTLLIGVFASQPASAFERTQTCRPDSEPRVDPQACTSGESPRSVAWPQQCVVFHINRTGLPGDEDADTVYDTIRAGFAAWDNVSCSFLSFATMMCCVPLLATPLHTTAQKSSK